MSSFGASAYSKLAAAAIRSCPMIQQNWPTLINQGTGHCCHSCCLDGEPANEVKVRLATASNLFPSFFAALPAPSKGDGVLIKVRHLLWRFRSCCWSRGWCAFLFNTTTGNFFFRTHLSLSLSIVNQRRRLFYFILLPHLLSCFCFFSSSVTVVPSEEWFDWGSVLPPFLFGEEFFSTSLLQCQRVYNLLLHAWIWRIH